MAAPPDPSVLAAYVPRLVREWVAEDPRPRHRTIPGSLVFADVSGFTALSERLARQGRAGAEAVNEIIDTCFTALIDEAYRFGGTLVQFGGDALLVLFRGDGHERRAVAGAAGMRAVLRSQRDFTRRVGRTPLSMTVGVNSGPVECFLVGRSHRQLVVGGPTVSALVALEAEAERGQILVGPATAAALAPRDLGARTRLGWRVRRPVPPGAVPRFDFLAATEEMEGYVAAGLRDAVRAGAVHSEHRTATVAFVEYRGLDGVLADHGPEEAARRLDALLAGVQDEIDEREICLQSADLGVDGGKLYLSAGAPRSSGHDEEQTLLAVRAVVDLDVGFALRAGVNTGSVFTGEIRTQHRRTFLTMGDAVNLAARLMAKAGRGEVLATPPVLDRSRTLFATDPLEPFVVKGKRRPVQAVRVGHAQGTRTSIAAADLPLVGRDAELAAVADALEGAAEGRGRSIVIVAEAGAGKSRLLDELASRHPGVPVVRVRCRLYQSSTPYFPVAELLRNLLPPGTDELDATRRALVAADPALEPWLPLVAAVLGLDAEPTDEVQELEPEFRAAQVHAVTARLLRSLLPGPAVVCVEDVHWMDDASEALLAVLAAGLADHPVVLVTTRRSGTEPRLAADVELPLAPLDGPALAELVRRATDRAPLPGHVVDALVARSGGNPLYLLELVHAVRSSGDLASLPSSVEGLLTARIDRLAPPDRAVLRHLSVLGARFSLDYVADVVPDGIGDPAPALVRRLDEFLAVEGSGEVAFRHHLVRDVAYEGLPYRTRRLLHRRIAESIVARVGDDLDEVAALLSLHFSRAGEHAAAWRTARRAGDRARAVYANAEAVVLYERALAAGTSLGVPAADRAEVLERLAQVQELAGQLADARRSLSAARRGAPGDDAAAQARLALQAAFLEERVGRFTAAIRSVREGQRRLAGTDGHDALRAELVGWEAAVRLAQGRFRDAVAASRQAIELAQRAAAQATLARAYLTHDFARLALGEDTDFAESRRALDIAAAIGDLGGEATAANNLGGYAFLAGRWDEAAALYRRARAARERTGDPVNAALSSANLAEILLEQGRLDEADAVLDEVLALWRGADDVRGVGFAARLRGLARARLGDVAGATALLAEAHAAFEGIGATGDALEVQVALAELDVLAGRPSEARRRLDAVLAGRPEEAGVDHVLPAVHRLRGLCLAGTDPNAAREEVAVALREARARGADHEVALALGAAELVALRSGGSPDPAAEAERSAIEARLGMRRRPALALAPPLSGTGTPDPR